MSVIRKSAAKKRKERNNAYERILFPEPAVEQSLIINAKMQRERNTHVYREPKVTSPSSFSIQRKCLPG